MDRDLFYFICEGIVFILFDRDGDLLYFSVVEMDCIYFIG